MAQQSFSKVELLNEVDKLEKFRRSPHYLTTIRRIFIPKEDCYKRSIDARK